MKNKIMLITYPDSLERNLSRTMDVLESYYKDAIGMIHFLPFYPSSGDRGFAPIRYDIVDERFGNYDDLINISKKHILMYDFMVNHISRESISFKDFILNREKSEYKDFFIRYNEFWGGKLPSKAEIDLIYKRKPSEPSLNVVFDDGTREKLWCTFSNEQVDLNYNKNNGKVKEFISDTITLLCENGASFIRLDAVAYAIKKRGTNCFFVEPEIWELLDFINEIALENGAEILPEVHENHTFQKKLAQRNYWTYDFTLPMLVLHAIYTHSCEILLDWISQSPDKQMTTLDTHDGIGVVDAMGVLTKEQIDYTQNILYEKGANIKRKYSTEEYNNLDIYQINCTFYSALGNNDDAYIIARCIQFFAPGIPQVYYVGMLAGENDIELLEKTKEGRNINRHYYSEEEIKENMARSVVVKIKNLMIFRNNHKSFDGTIKCTRVNSHRFVIVRQNGIHRAELEVDLEGYKYKIKATNPSGVMEEIVI